MEIEYAEDKTLLLPVERFDLVQKYSGVEGVEPVLDRLGGAGWARRKASVRKAMRDMTDQLLKLYARRSLADGFAFSKDSPWQKEFEDAFEYVETPDQAQAIADVKRDMQSGKPMDRLLCGDVGYGKTEVAMRAAFKAVLDGKQVAVLAPTTILADQHFRTFRRRFAAFPVDDRAALALPVAQRAEGGRREGRRRLGRHPDRDAPDARPGPRVPRPRPPHRRRGAALRRRAEGAAQGVEGVDRRALDVGDADPALAPPLALGPARPLDHRDAAAGPARDRDAGRARREPEVIREAIEAEIAPRRPGLLRAQPRRVDRPRSSRCSRSCCPSVRIAVAHGQMPEAELEKAMLRFFSREADVLLATTIVENGLDIPSANTILIDRAETFGLAQLYQLRGRVGRSDKPAYAYLLVARDGRALGRRAAAPRVDPGVLRPRRRVPHRGQGPRDPRLGQHARRRAVGPHRRRRLRDVPVAARGGDPRDPGRGAAARARRHALARPRPRDPARRTSPTRTGG